MLLLPTISRGWSGSALTASAVSSMTVDITGATVGEWVYAAFVQRTNETSYTFTGWTPVQTLLVNGTAQSMGAYKRLKVSGDTTFTLSWTATTTQCIVYLQQWPGVIGDEAESFQNVTSGGNVFTSPSTSATQDDRWAVGFFTGQNTDSTNKTATWTPSGSMVTKIQSGANVNGSLQWNQAMMADSNGPVSAGAHTGTGTTSGTATINNGGAGLFYLIPSPGRGDNRASLQAVNRGAVI
jgi:hypothetical protein